MKKFGLFAWSMGIFFPEINKVGDSETQGTLNRTICKINFRTPAAGLRSDMSSLDFYTVSYQDNLSYNLHYLLIEKTLFRVQYLA